MTKHGFAIRLNDETLCRAGLDIDFYVVSCCLTSMMRKKDEHPGVSLHVGGLNSVNQNHVNWIDQELKAGDRITIEIIENDFEPPAKITIQNVEELVLSDKIKYYHKLKEELKDHLNE